MAMAISKRLQFIQGLFAGLLITFIFIGFNTATYKSAYSVFYGIEEDESNKNHTRTNGFHLQDDKYVHNDDDSVARKLSDKVRVLVAVLTSPNYLSNRAQSVKDTWAKRCNKIIFLSSAENKTFPTIGLNVSEGYGHLTAKTMIGFQYIYENYINDFDWFMKADDDTYIIVENLRYFLAGQNTSEPVYFGHHFRPHVKQGYHGGGAGYVLSKEALRRFGEKGNNSKCQTDLGAEDVQIGRCLESLGVYIANSTDSLGRSRFHSLSPEAHLSGVFPRWYKHYDVHGAKKGEESISDYIISFHRIGPQKMMELEFYAYHMRPYGIFNGAQDLNTNSTRSFN